MLINSRISLCVALVVGPLVLSFKANLNALTLETTLESLLIKEQESAHQYRTTTSEEPADVEMEEQESAHRYRTTTSEEPADVEMEEEETTPRPMPKELPDTESETDLDNERFQTPLAVLRKKRVRNAVMDSDDMSEGERPVAKVNQDQSEMKGKKAIRKVGCYLKPSSETR